MDTKTIIYLTDNTLNEKLASLCRKNLLEVAGDIPIVSVSQEPIKLGMNICMGKIGKSWISLYKQLLAGLKAIKTKFISIAEHDCLYTNEHFRWIPPRVDTFYYNMNCWLTQWGGNHPELDGMYSRWHDKRWALSQLVCARDLLKKSVEERLNLLLKGETMDERFLGAGEFGVMTMRMIHKAKRIAKSGQSFQLQRYLKNFLAKQKAEAFKTTLPNLDIRHSTNFTGPKRGKHRCYSVPYWGKFEELING